MASAKILCETLNFSTFLLFFGWVFFPKFHVQILVVLLVIPWMMLALVRFFPEDVILSDKRFNTSRQADGSSGFMVSILGAALIVLMDPTTILNWKNFWLPFALITTALAMPGIYFSQNNAKGRIEAIAAVLSSLLFFGLYGYSFTISINIIFDRSLGICDQAKVVSKRIHFKKSRTYYLTLSPVGPVKEQQEHTVSEKTFQKYNEGDIIKVVLHDGLFHIPWCLLE